MFSSSEFTPEQYRSFHALVDRYFADGHACFSVLALLLVAAGCSDDDTTNIVIVPEDPTETELGRGEDPPGMLHVRLEREGKAGWLCEYEGRHLTMRCLLWSIRPATYRITVWGGEWLPVQAHGVVVLEGQPAPEVQLVLTVKGGSVVGRVLDVHGKAIPNALVTWRGLDNPGPWPLHERCVEADEQGGYHLMGLPPGRYRVSGGPFTGPFVEDELEVAAEQTATHDLQVSR